METKGNEKENKTNHSLMRKTKVQLIDIIFRKDSVEQELRTKIKELEKENKSLDDNYTILNSNHQALIKDYETLIAKRKEYKKLLEEANILADTSQETLELAMKSLKLRKLTIISLALVIIILLAYIWV